MNIVDRILAIEKAIKKLRRSLFRKNYKVYVASISQIAPGAQDSGSLLIGEVYTINEFIEGAPASLSTLVGGTGYLTGSNIATTGGSGTGLKVSITASGGLVTSVTIYIHGKNYAVNDTITISGGGGNATFKIASVSSDDFSNVADVTSGTINTDGCVFTATGEVPAAWTNASTLTSAGIPRANIHENTFETLPTWERFDTGQFRLSFHNGELPFSKSYLLVGTTAFSYTFMNMDMDDIISVITADYTMTVSDNVFGNTTLEIRAYE